MPVATIRHLTVRGYRSIRDADLDLGPFTVLVGANGSGKSNFISFLRLMREAFSGSVGGLQPHIARAGHASTVLHYGPKVTPALSFGLSLGNGVRQTRYSAELAWGAPDSLFFAREALELCGDGAPPTSVELTGGRSESALVTSLREVRPDALQAAAAELVGQIRAVRDYHFHDTGEAASVRLAQDRSRDDRLRGDAGNLAAFLLQLRESWPDNYERILRTVQLVAPFFRDFEIRSDAADQRLVLLRWRDSSGTVLGPHQLSDGTLRAISLITALLQPDELMPSVLVFDEPELGLHPSAVSLVADLLEDVSGRRQVVVATQSPLLLRNYRPGAVVVVERCEHSDGHGESVFSHLDPDGLAGWLEDFDLGELYEKNVTGGYPR